MIQVRSLWATKTASLGLCPRSFVLLTGISSSIRSKSRSIGSLSSRSSFQGESTRVSDVWGMNYAKQANRV
jgi:hypothetical protein